MRQAAARGQVSFSIPNNYAILDTRLLPRDVVLFEAAPPQFVLEIPECPGAVNGVQEIFANPAGPREHSHLAVRPLLQAVVGAVQQFSGDSEQQDDITVVIARCLA